MFNLQSHTFTHFVTMFIRIKTEEKAKVVAVVWGTYLNAALAI